MAAIAMRALRPLCRSSNATRFALLGSARHLSFSFAGPKKLDDVLKKELVQDKSGTELADIWYTYHEGKVSCFL